MFSGRWGKLGAMTSFRIGSGAGYAGDRIDPAQDLAERGQLNALVFECLAERTIALAQLRRSADPTAGFDPLLAERMRAVLPACVALGLKDYELIAYFAVYAPAGTPADIVAKLNQAVNAAANSKDVQEKFAGIGFAVQPGTPDDLAKRGALETAKWAKAIKDAKIEAQ